MNSIIKIFTFLKDYTDILAVFIALYSLWRTRKQCITPKIRVYINNKKWPMRSCGSAFSIYHNGPDKMLNIENVGETGITIIDVKINEIPVTEIINIANANYLINANLPPRNIASSECYGPEKLLGSIVCVKVKTDEKKTFDLKVTLCEVQ